MTVYIHMANKETITVEHTNDAEAVWSKINIGAPIDRGRGSSDMVIVNKANVNSVTVGR